MLLDHTLHDFLWHPQLLRHNKRARRSHPRVVKGHVTPPLTMRLMLSYRLSDAPPDR